MLLGAVGAAGLPGTLACKSRRACAQRGEAAGLEPGPGLEGSPAGLPPGPSAGLGWCPYVQACAVLRVSA